MPLENRLLGAKARLIAPALSRNPLMFLGCDLDGVLPTATAAVMAAPILDRRQLKW
jgi:hypothetical protein